jgi:hypothetical protein
MRYHTCLITPLSSILKWRLLLWTFRSSVQNGRVLLHQHLHRPTGKNFFVISNLKPHTSHLTPHNSHLTTHTSHLTPHTSHLTPHTSHLTPHTSHLTPHTSHLTSVAVLTAVFSLAVFCCIGRWDAGLRCLFHR